MDRLDRAEKGGEGSSRYRMEWDGGLIELHSYCVGWYAEEPSSESVIFIRSLERIVSCTGPRPLTPGQYEVARMNPVGSDELLQTAGPLIAWILFYEEEVRKLEGLGYREDCWRRFLAKMGARPWLPPSEAQSWFQRFLDNPERTPRPRDFFRSTAPSHFPAGFLKKDPQFSF